MPTPSTFEDKFSPYLKDPSSIMELGYHEILDQSCNVPMPWHGYRVLEPSRYLINMSTTMSDNICNHCMRFMLKNPHNAAALMEDIKNGALYVEVGGQIVIRVPMNVNLLVLDELVRLKRRSHGIRTISATEIYDSDLDNYMYKDLPDGVTYLDVPLLFGFFMYGQELGSCLFSTQRIYFEFDHRPYDMYNAIYMIPETPPTIGSSIDSNWSILIMGCNTQLIYYSPHREQTRYIVWGAIIKFIIVTVAALPDEILPEITSVTISTGDRNIYSLDPTYFYVRDLLDRRVYVISPDPETDMRDWVKVVDECKHGKRYPPVNLSSGDIIIDFDCAPNPYMQVDLITQNILCGAAGAAHVRFSS